MILFDILCKTPKNKAANRFFVDLLLRYTNEIGNNIRFVHKGLGVVISEGATIGDNVCIQH